MNPIQRLAELLAESPLADEIKTVIIENAHALKPSDISSLIQSLEREQDELRSLQEDLAHLDALENDERQQQERIVRNYSDKFLAEILKELIQKH